RLDEALEAFRKSVALSPTDVAWSNIGTLEYYEGRFTAASDAYEKAVALVPGHYETWANLGDASGMLPGQDRRASEAYARSVQLSRKELETNPENAHVHSYLALALAKLGKIAEARDHSSRALQIEPGNPELLYNAAVVARRAGRRSEAIENIRRAVGAGYNGELIRRDPEFRDLRADPDFQRAVQTPTAEA